MRVVLGALGAAIGGFGLFLLLGLGAGNLVATGSWLVGGVLVHDGLVGPALVVSGLLLTRVVPVRRRGPMVVGAVVLGTVTATAIPVLGRFGAREDNPTLLDRDYLAGWVLFAGLVVLVTGLGMLAAGRRKEP